jgi:branched-chain amino acid transport system permease protein
MAAVLSSPRLPALPKWPAWTAFAALLLAAPLAFGGGAGLSILSQTAITMVFALSYNMLLGQGGMLSFGHAVYSGLGAFFVVHAMNLAAAGTFPVPVTLMPLVGGVCGSGIALVLGWVITRKAGTTFAMITLGIVELVHASALIFRGFFGGEGGVSTNRVIGQSVLGVSYATQVQVYYLIAGWLFVCTAAMYALTRTPLGKLANAVRDNPQRAGYIGYDAQCVRFITLVLSAFFAGIAGGLAAINYEIVTAENVGLPASGMILLFVFIGGTAFFWGPLIGAAIGVLMTVVVADYSSAWPFYLGLFFMVMVVWAPGGIASLVLALGRLVRHGELRTVSPALARAGAAALAALSGLVCLVEMLYHRTLSIDPSVPLKLFGQAVLTTQPAPWIAGVAMLLAGVAGLVLNRPSWRRAIGEANGRVAAAARRELA